MPTFTQYVEVDVDIDDLIEACSDDELHELRIRLAGDGSSVSPDAVRAYYALRDGDMETVRRFVCDCAGRIG